MPQFKWNKIELLDRKHRGLKQFVQACYDDGISRDKVAKLIKERFRLQVSRRVLQRYRDRRYIPHTKRIEQIVERLEAVTEFKKRHPEEPLREALIFEKLFEMPAHLLHRRDVDMKRLEAQNRKLDIEKKRAETQGEAVRAKLEQARASAGNGGKQARPAKERAKNEEELRERIGEIYGIGKARRPPASVPAKVD